MLQTKMLQPHDLHWLDLHTPVGWVDVSTMRQLADSALSISFFEDGLYRGSAGVYKVWHGVYEAWLMLLAMPKDLRGFLKTLRWGIAKAFELTQAHRIQAYCLASFTKGIKLATRLGFVQEGVLRQGSPDRSDMVLLSRVPSWA
jgi:hypothetical protein